MFRYRLDAERVRIGRDTSNDIWLDNPAVRPHTLLVYKKDGEHCIKVFDGAKVLLNGVPVAGMHRLYSGDRIVIADREFLYGRDDSPAEVAVGLTVLLDGIVQHAIVFRRTRIHIGRRDADVLLNDPSVSDRHLVIECYSDDGLYAFDLGSTTGTRVDGRKVEERCRLHDGTLVQIGRVGLRVHILPSDAHGLLLAAPLPEQPKVPLGAPAPMDRSPGQRHDPGAQSPRSRNADSRPVAGGFIRPLHAQNAGSALPAAQRPPPPPPEPDLDEAAGESVPVTAIGSLQQLRRDSSAMLQQSDDQKLVEMPVISANPSSNRPPPLPRRDDRPAVRLKPEIQQEAPAWQDRARRDPGRGHEDPDGMVQVSPSPTGFHDQHTSMLGAQTPAPRGRAQADWPEPEPTEKPKREARSGGAPRTQVLDVIEPAVRKSGLVRLSRDGAGRRPQTLVGQADDAPRGPAQNRLLERKPPSDAGSPPPLPVGADRSARPSHERYIDRSRRGFDPDDTNPEDAR